MIIHCTKSAFYAINNVHGITLTTLVVTIVVLLILAGVATYSGIEAIDNTKRTKFIAELKIMQSYVNQWYEDCKPSVNAKKYEETFASNVQTKFTINDKVSVNVASTEPINSEKVTIAQTALAAANVPSENYGNFYLLEDNEKSALGVEGVSQAVLVSVRDRKVVSYLGLKYKGNMYYTIDSLDSENGIDAIYNVGYENPNTNTPTLQITGRSIYNGETAKGAKYKFTVDVKYKFPGDVIQDSDYINKGDLYYGKIENGEVKNWNKTEDKTFIVDRDGTYQFRYIDAAGNESEKIDYVIEPKTKLIAGSNINSYMKQLSGQTDAITTTVNTTITDFKLATEKPSSDFLNDTELVKNIAATGSLYPVYIWYNNGIIWCYSDDNWIGMNAKSSETFRSLQVLKNIDFKTFDTRYVTNMNFMFYLCKIIPNLDLSNFNTEKVTQMSNMFAYCSELTSLDLLHFDTTKVTTFQEMFKGCTNIKSIKIKRPLNGARATMNSMFHSCSSLTDLDISELYTENVINMIYMFHACNSIETLDLSHFDTSSVTSMTYMFGYCSNLSNLNITSFDTKNVSNFNHVFLGCTSLTSLDLSSFDTKSATTMSQIFMACSNLKTIYTSDLFVINESTSAPRMFIGCTALEGGNGTKCSEIKVYDGTYAWIDGKIDESLEPPAARPGYFTRKTN